MALEVEASWPPDWPDGRGGVRQAAARGMAAVHALQFRDTAEGTAVVIPQRTD